MWKYPLMGVPIGYPQIIHFHGIFRYKPSISHDYGNPIDDIDGNHGCEAGRDSVARSDGLLVADFKRSAVHRAWHLARK